MLKFVGKVLSVTTNMGLEPPVVDGSYYQEDYLFGVQLNFSDALNINRSSSASSTVVTSDSDNLVAEFKAGLFVYKESRNIALVSMYVPLFLLATVSNLLVITMVFRYRRFRSATNYLLVNLSLADLMVTLICMPMAVGTNVYRSWIYGNMMCKASTYMEGVAVAGSVFTLTAMSIHRYMAIRHPMTFRKLFNRTLALKVIAGVWAVSLALFVPVLFVRRTEGFFVTRPEPQFRFVFCVEKWSDEDDRRIYSAFLFAVVYAIPGYVIVATYSKIGCTLRTTHHLSSSVCSSTHAAAFKLIKGRRKVARIMLVLALIFAFCWLPYNIVMLILETSSDYRVHRYCLDVLPFTLLIGHSNSAVNPILYCFLAKPFRIGVRETLATCCRKTTILPTPPQTMPTGKRSKYKQPTHSEDSSCSNASCFPNCFLATSNAHATSSFTNMDKPISSTVACCPLESPARRKWRNRHIGKRAVLIVVTNVAKSAVMNSSSDDGDSVVN